MSLNIVVDTNVFLGALLSPGGENRKLIRRCFESHYQPLMGNALFCEYEDVINRPEILKKCSLTSTERQQFLASFMHICEWVKISYLWRPNVKDEKDHHLIELAVAGNARFLITHNIKDFRKMELTFDHLTISTPHEFLKETE